MLHHFGGDKGSLALHVQGEHVARDEEDPVDVLDDVASADVNVKDKEDKHSESTKKRPKSMEDRQDRKPKMSAMQEIASYFNKLFQ